MSTRPNDLAPYRDAGYQLIPLRVRDKMPFHRQWRNRKYTDEEIDQLIGLGHNMGVRLCETDLIIDVDPRNMPEGRDTIQELADHLGVDFSEWPCVITGSGGLHVYTSIPSGIRVRNELPEFPGVEYKSLGRQVVAAGSIHPNGEYYRWAGDGGSDGPDLALLGPKAAPDALIELVRRPACRLPESPQDCGGDWEGYGMLEVSQLKDALDQIDVEAYNGAHETWLELGMACYFATAGQGMDEFVEWSCGDEDYADHEQLIRDRWPTWAPEAGQPMITCGTLFFHLREAGGELEGLYTARFPDDLPPEPEIRGDDPDAPAPDVGRDGILDKLNRIFALAPEGDKVFIFQRTQDGEGWRRLSLGSFKDLLSGQKIQRDTPEGPKLVSLANEWLNWSEKRSYKGVQFAPHGAAPGYLNLFHGWGVKPKEGGSWEMLRTLMEQDLFPPGKDQAPDENMDYVLNWLAWFVQHPEILPEVAIVMRGDPGVGKGTFGRMITRLAGMHGVQLNSMKQLTGRFNAHMQTKIALFADEAFWAASGQSEATLKGMITEPHAHYERKGGTPYMGPNFSHLVMASNSDWVVPAQLGERRFAIFDVREGARRDKPWFARLNTELEEGGYEQLMHDLQSRTLGEHPRMNVPQTKELLQQKLMSLEPISEWWYELLLQGEPPSGTMFDNAEGSAGEGWDAKPIAVSGSQLAMHLQATLGRGRDRPKSIQTRMGRWLRKAVPGLRKIRFEGSRCYEIPDLGTCRKGFEALVGDEIDWDGDE